MFLSVSALPLLALFLLLAFPTYLVSLIVYNFFLHPLSRIPGPALARTTSFYKLYIELICSRSWTHHLQHLHACYGAVVRVGANELHWSTPQAYFDIYNAANRWDKEKQLYHAFGEEQTSFGYLTYRESKARKDVLQPLFSRRAICSSGMQGLIRDKVGELVGVLGKRTSQGLASDLFYAMRCFTVDSIMMFCFGRSVGALETQDFKAPVVVAMDSSNGGWAVLRHLSLVRWCLFNMPDWLSLKLSPDTKGLLELQQLLRAQVDEVYNDKSLLVAEANDGRQTIYHRLLDPSVQRGRVPMKQSLYEEAQTMIFAGTDTLGNALYVGIYELAKDRDLQRRMREEIRSASKEVGLEEEGLTFEQLEKLPLLTAVIKETLRLNSGVPSPLLRIVPKGGAVIDGLFIPHRTIVGVSSVFLNHDTNVFPQPKSFRPERWLGEKAKELDKYLVAFSKGPRMCLGINLAWCELYYAFTALVKRFEIELVQEQELELDEDGNLGWKDAFLPWYTSERVKCWFREVTG